MTKEKVKEIKEVATELDALKQEIQELRTEQQTEIDSIKSHLRQLEGQIQEVKLALRTGRRSDLKKL